MSISKKINCTVLVNDPVEEEILQMAIQDISTPIFCSFFNNAKKFLVGLQHPTPLPDCIILDSDIGAMNRQECLEKIKQIPAVSKVPVFLFSGILSETETFKLKDAGIFGFIPKANSIGELKTNLLSFFTNTFAINTETGI